MKTFKRILSLPFLASPGIAEATSAPSFWSDPINDPRLPTFLTIGAVFIVIFLVALVAVSTMSAIRTLTHSTTNPNDVTQSNFDYRKLILYGSTVILIGMVILYNGTGLFSATGNEPIGENQITSPNNDLQSAQINEDELAYDQNDVIIQNGRKIYVTHCAACHNSEGQGSVGPNLTDSYWLHGGSIKDIYGIIKTGAPDKGMIAWENILTSGQIRDVTFYIKSIEGTIPANPKPPQGTLWRESMVASAADERKEN